MISEFLNSFRTKTLRVKKSEDLTLIQSYSHIQAREELKERVISNVKLDSNEQKTGDKQNSSQDKDNVQTPGFTNSLRRKGKDGFNWSQVADSRIQDQQNKFKDKNMS